MVFEQIVKRLLPLWLGIALFAGTGWLTENLVETKRHAVNISRQIEFRKDLYSVREKIDRSLAAVINRSTGVIAYVQSKSGKIEAKEISALLEALYSDSSHVRNFGLAQDTTIRHVYPSAGNQQALGVDYRTVPEQWPSVLAAMNSEAGILSGPVELIQGGQALIFRIPVRVDGEYWGMLSTVINLQSYLNEITQGELLTNGQLAIQSQTGEAEAILLGDANVFSHPRIQQIEVHIPGGNWLLGFVPVDRIASPSTTIWRVLGWVLGALLGLGLATILIQRKALQQLVLIDELTGIANRRHFDLMLAKYCQKYRRRNSGCFALLYIDLDGFKALNDQFGHRAGDHYLIELARRATQAIRGSDLLARWGGDEFAIILDNPTQASIDRVVDRVRSLCEQPIQWRGVQLQVGASIGVVRYPEDGTTAEALVSMADQNMYADKDQRRQQ